MGSRYRSKAEIEHINEYYKKKKDELYEKVSWGWCNNYLCTVCHYQYDSIAGMYTSGDFFGAFCSVECLKQRIVDTPYRNYDIEKLEGIPFTKSNLDFLKELKGL